MRRPPAPWAFPRALFATVLTACATPPAPHASPPERPAISTSGPVPDAAAPPASPTRFALVHVTVVDVTTGTEQLDRAVLVDGDRIAAIVASDAVPASPPSRHIDLPGKFVIPGLWDMHVHFADPASAKLFVANGVTGVRVMWGNPPFLPGMERFHFDMRDAFDQKKTIGPRMVIASQLLDGPKPIWPNSVALSSPEEGRKAVDDAKTSGADFIKVYSLLPRDIYFAIVDESKKDGLPFAGHVPESVSVEEASAAGQRSMEHLLGMIVACSSHEDLLRRRAAEFAKKNHSPAEWSKFHGKQLEEARATYDTKHAQALFAQLVAHDTWQCPTLTEEHNTASQDDPSLEKDARMQYILPFVRKMWRPKDRPPGEYEFMRSLFGHKLMLVGAMNQAGVPLLAGTDEFNPYCFAGFGLHDELVWLVKAGLSPVEALRAATSGPARFLGREAEMGTVAEGRMADLVVLDDDPLVNIANTTRIAAVVLRGTLYDRAALDGMLEEVKYGAAHPRWGGTN
jgi:hypothetical protein